MQPLIHGKRPEAFFSLGWVFTTAIYLKLRKFYKGSIKPTNKSGNGATMGQISTDRVHVVREKLPDQNNNPEASSGLLVSFQEEDHIGKRKKEQQDAHGHLHIPANRGLKRPAGYLFVVADGVSMGQAGALASKTAVEVILKDFQRCLDEGQTDLSMALAEAFGAGNYEVYQLARTRQGMATTCVAALVCGQTLITAHVGDSRIYLSRQGLGLMQVTVDHSWVAEMGQIMVKQGLMSAQDLLRDSRRHTITRAFGLQETIPADINAAELKPGDLVVLCSDGLWDLIPEELLDSATRDNSRANLPALSHKLVGAAMDAGGRDNITLTLVRIDQVDRPVEFLALAPMLEQTSQEVAERTRPIEVNHERKTISNFPQSTPKPTSTFNLSSRTEPPKQAGPAGKTAEVPMQIEDQPSMKLPILNPEVLLAKAQKSFALGDWDKAMDYYIDIELIQASYHGLYESFSNAIIRYVGIAIGESQVEQAESLIKHLENNNIQRYMELLADYCNDESRRAATAYHYPASKAYAQFCLRLRPNDVRARNLSELAELYLTLQKPRIPLSERLAVAQKVYAREENYGKIQDDLATIYMELGDEATRLQALEDASGWYSMIMALKPLDSRLLSLASNKLRSVKDDLSRRPMTNLNTSPTISDSIPPQTPNGSTATFKALDRTLKDVKPEQELINRLKDRVSRAQKAWDGGRKEVGSEYIYLVDQLNEQLSPNPWQQTLPRVCYDYGKWLLDQRQYDEARPYFQKAQQLGMAAAQQRVKEVDRLIKEKTQGTRGPTPLDLPESLSTQAQQPPFSLNNSSYSARPANPAETTEPKEKESGFNLNNLTNAASLFTPRRSEKISGPMIPPKPVLPSDGIFVGKTRAPDANLNPSLDALPSITNPSNPLTVQPRSAALIASGTWNREPEETLNSPIGQPRENTRSKPVVIEPARPVKPPLTSGGPRGIAPWLGGDNLQLAARREVSRAAGFSLPKEHPMHRQKGSGGSSGFLGVLSGLVLPGLVIGVVGLALIIVWQLVMPKIGQNVSTNTSVPSASVTKGASISASAGLQTSTSAASTSSVAPLSGVQGIVRIEGVKPDEIVVFLATAGDPNSPYRELSQEATFFRLPVTTLNRLDPQQKYIVVIRPKDTANRKYAVSLSPDNASQKPFISPQISFDPSKGFDTTMRITTEMLAFYPLKGGDTDQDQPGGRYIGATHHGLSGDFLAYYNASGGLGRFGFPISEEFDWAGNGHVQFFERGWLTSEGTGKPVTIGKVSRALLDSPCTTVLRLPANVTPLAVPTIKPDEAFAATAEALKLGAPQTQAFDGPDKLKVQYFELGRLELDTANKDAKPALGLLGSEFSRCSGWLK